MIKKLEKEVIQLRGELESVIEEASECESDYLRIKQEGSLLCSKYDEVCDKLREASAEYNHLCDIYDAQVRKKYANTNNIKQMIIFISSFV